MTTSSISSHRAAAPALRVLGGLCAGALLWALSSPAAFAQGRLDARYEATLAGIPVGKGAWTIDISDDSFSASAFGGTAGLLKAFAGGSGTGASQGRVVNGALVATNYSASTTTSKQTEAIHMVLANGGIKEFLSYKRRNRGRHGASTARVGGLSAASRSFGLSGSAQGRAGLN